jgi:hypothetical protein
MKSFPTSIQIIEKFIQSQIDENVMDNEYILALNECTTLEDLIYEVGSYRTDVLKDYQSIANYILMSLDKEYD